MGDIWNFNKYLAIREMAYNKNRKGIFFHMA